MSTQAITNSEEKTFEESKATMAVRYLLALMMIVFGANKFAQFIPMPPANDQVAQVFGSLMMMGILPIAGVLELVGGIMLAIKKQVPITLIVLGAIGFNAFLFHATLDPAGIGGATVFLGMVIYLAYAYRSKYISLVR
ncbi:DoxX family membrane protein [Flammeovirga yaeyamensis]|uniref:DoxX family membrane protein n=1 Tax=Flammeovirga yaeyamensis TaxID=367791 RepID=A0AAX1N7B6_9BACT|nr:MULTISPECIES: DoxX family membrane protein [Flammeovirga]ANQ50676.1 DoxX family membrane protein [Flammeovirga sp. MY04]MBB3701026.1 putative membrane protein YphA (DoxX/SURF4 family) [Flammeovirga yaeyamensis]NMF38141.1 DoxX family membrane protein [Flammeovirga yaeyamensis]QWG01912.1 DoxX family membrane protein [Flammeovirga yaeyamensis]